MTRARGRERESTAAERACACVRVRAQVVCAARSRPSWASSFWCDQPPLLLPPPPPPLGAAPGKDERLDGPSRAWRPPSLPRSLLRPGARRGGAVPRRHRAGATKPGSSADRCTRVPLAAVGGEPPAGQRVPVPSEGALLAPGRGRRMQPWRGLPVHRWQHNRAVRCRGQRFPGGHVRRRHVCRHTGA